MFLASLSSCPFFSYSVLILATEMFLYAVRRVAVLAPTVIIVMLITFTLGYFGPIDPVRAVLGEDWEDETRYAEVKKALGLDRPFMIQFLDYMGTMFGGNWGQSLSAFGGVASDRAVSEGRGAGFSGTSTSVREMVLGRLVISAQLSFWALVFLIVFAILLGVLAAVKQNTTIDYAIVTSSIVASSIPAYVIGPVLLIIFVLKIPVFKTVGGWDGMFSRQAILPAIVLATGPMLVIVRQTRAGIIEVLGKDFVRTARAKGMPERLVIGPPYAANSYDTGADFDGACYKRAADGKSLCRADFQHSRHRQTGDSDAYVGRSSCIYGGRPVSSPDHRDSKPADRSVIRWAGSARHL